MNKFQIRLNQIMEEKNVKPAELSKMTGIGKSSISQWLSGRYSAKQDKIYIIAQKLHVSPSWLMGESNNKKFYSGLDMTPKELIEATQQNTAMIPLIGSIACGEPIFADQNIEGYVPTFASGIPAGNNFWLKCKGKSMEPTIKDGTMVLIHEQPDVENDEIAAVMVNGEGTLKRVKKTGKQIILLPENNDFPPIILSPDDENKIIGKAIKFMGNL